MLISSKITLLRCFFLPGVFSNLLEDSVNVKHKGIHTESCWQGRPLLFCSSQGFVGTDSLLAEGYSAIRQKDKNDMQQQL